MVFWKSQTFSKSLETFGSRIFLLRFLKSIGWYGFSFGFLVVLMCFINVLFKFITNLKFYKKQFYQRHLQKHFCFIIWCLVSKEIHRLGPMDLKIYKLERNPRLRLDSWRSLETFAKIISVTSISGLPLGWPRGWGIGRPLICPQGGEIHVSDSLQPDLQSIVLWREIGHVSAAWPNNGSMGSCACVCKQCRAILRIFCGPMSCGGGGICRLPGKLQHNTKGKFIHIITGKKCLQNHMR